MLDHLVYGVPSLTAGIDSIERETGVRARLGGSHPGRGTHNALLSLGPGHYLEIIALDPAQSDVPDLLFPELRHLRVASLVSWAISVADIEDATEQAQAANLRLIGPLDGSRMRSDGSLLRWKTLRIAAPSFALVPFFIAWDKETIHPSQDSPSGCKLVSVEIQHTDPDRLRRLLGKLAGEVRITPGPRSRLMARIETPNGAVELG